MSIAVTLADVLKSAPSVASLSGLAYLCATSSGELKRYPKVPFVITTVYNDGQAITDLDTLVSPGWYAFYHVSQNCPKGVNTAGQLMLVWSHAEGYVIQFLISGMWDDGSKGLYLRNRNGASGKWSTWGKIAISPIT